MIEAGAAPCGVVVGAVRWVLVVAVLILAPACGGPELPSADQLPVVEELPDPFLMNDGTRVETEEGWRRRREELIEAILYYQYGTMPPAPDNMKAEEVSSVVDPETGATHRSMAFPDAPRCYSWSAPKPSQLL